MFTRRAVGAESVPGPQQVCTIALLLSVGAMKNTKLKTRASILHVDSSHPSHARDKKAGDARKEFKFFTVKSSPRPCPKRDFSTCPAIEVIHDPDTDRWTVCTTKGAYGNYLLAESAARTRYYAPVLRRGRKEMMARIDPSPLSNHTISFHPAASSMLADMLAKGEGQDVPRRILSLFIKQALPLFAERGREVVGCATHMDCDDAHVEVTVARNSRDGRRLGKAGMDLVGPWTVAVARQVDCCGPRINSEKLNQYESALAVFRRRAGPDAVPFDIQLARLFDVCSHRILGPGLQAYVQRYADGVPQSEREQLYATKAELEAALAQVCRCLVDENSRSLLVNPLPQPTPEFPQTCPPVVLVPPPTKPLPLAGKYVPPYQPIF